MTLPFPKRSTLLKNVDFSIFVYSSCQLGLLYWNFVAFVVPTISSCAIYFWTWPIHFCDYWNFLNIPKFILNVLSKINWSKLYQLCNQQFFFFCTNGRVFISYVSDFNLLKSLFLCHQFFVFYWTFALKDPNLPKQICPIVFLRNNKWLVSCQCFV